MIMIVYGGSLVIIKYIICVYVLYDYNQFCFIPLKFKTHACVVPHDDVDGVCDAQDEPHGIFSLWLFRWLQWLQLCGQKWCFSRAPRRRFLLKQCLYWVAHSTHQQKSLNSVKEHIMSPQVIRNEYRSTTRKQTNHRLLCRHARQNSGLWDFSQFYLTRVGARFCVVCCCSCCCFSYCCCHRLLLLPSERNELLC